MPTYTCPSCKSCFSEADKQWDIAIAFAKCPNCLMSLRDFAVPTKPEKLQPIGAAASVQPSGVPSAPRFCTSCGAPTRASARFCTKCGCTLNFPARTNRQEKTPPAQQPWDGAFAIKRATGWRLWVFMALIALIVRFFGLLGGLVFWGLWSLSALLIKKYKTRGALTDTPTIDTTHKKTDQRVGAPKPAVIIDPPLDRQYSDDPPERRVQTTPPDASKAMFPSQPTANPIAPVSIPAEPITTAIETHEDRLYAQIAQELDTNTVDKGLWTKAYAQAGGDDQQTRVLYIKARLARLLAMEDAQREATRREQQEAARRTRVDSIRSNLQGRIDKIENAEQSSILKQLAAGHVGNDFLYHCGLGKWFVGDVQRTFEANPFVLDRTTLDEGYTGLHIAVQSKDKKMIEYLIEQGANIQARDSQGKTPIDVARETNQPEVVELLERYRAEG